MHKSLGFGDGNVQLQPLWLCYWAQFHQRSTHSFYVRKLRVQLFCAYNLGLYFTGAGLLVQKLCVERW